MLDCQSKSPLIQQSPLISTDPSLTIENVIRAISGMKNWHRFGWWIDVPLSKRDTIKKEIPNLEDQVNALIREWLSNHPAPSWRLLAWALLRRREAPEHNMLKNLYGNYIPGELAIFCTHHACIGLTLFVYI